ncbi:MAG TPA: hypothetical protein VM938_06115 [Acidimicrobiales bacterium]|nr:hypothetical protein [Acidimicrobiales bacterium]
MITQLRNGLGLLLFLCLVIRVTAWVVMPVVPLLVVLFTVTALLVWLVRPYSNWRR